MTANLLFGPARKLVIETSRGRSFTVQKRIAIVMPVLDDWASFEIVIEMIGRLFDGGAAQFHVVAVDDGSSVGFIADRASWCEFSCLHDIEVIHLAVNLGHQRAIAVGLSVVARRDHIDMVVVMDSDGEDRPEDIATLLAMASRHPNHAVLARRAQRSEGVKFRVGYVFYKALFRLFTGRVIDFGNFCLLPIGTVRRLVHMPDLWNNLPAAIMRSRVRTVAVPTARGVRHAGRSHMNLPALVIHGLSAMSVYSDLIFVRVLLASAVSGVIAVLGIGVVALVRMATTLAIPGWATTAFGDLIIILMQTVVIVIATTLMVLNTRSQRPIIPFVDAPAFVASRQLVVARSEHVAGDGGQ